MEARVSRAESWRRQMETSCQGMPGVDRNPVMKADFSFSLEERFRSVRWRQLTQSPTKGMAGLEREHLLNGSKRQGPVKALITVTFNWNHLTIALGDGGPSLLDRWWLEVMTSQGHTASWEGTAAAVYSKHQIIQRSKGLDCADRLMFWFCVLNT